MIASTASPKSPAAWLRTVLAAAASAAVLAAHAAGASAPPADPAAAPTPLPPSGEMARCKLLIDQGRHGAARARLEPIVEQHPKWARATALLALTYYKEKRFEVAKELFARSLELDPDEIAARPLLGWSLYSLGELDAAQAMFESLLERKPDYAAGHYSLGVIFLDRDEVEAARRAFEKAAGLAGAVSDAPMEGRARARLGDLYVRLGDLAEARGQLEVALELFPEEREAWFKLSRVLQRQGDSEGAAEARRRFEELKGEQPSAPLLPIE